MLFHHIFKNIDQFRKNLAFTAIGDNNEKKSISYEDVYNFSRIFGTHLDRKYENGSVVAICLPNSLSYAVCAMGALYSRSVLVNINPNYTITEIKEAINKSNTKLLVANDLKHSDQAKLINETCLEEIIITTKPNSLTVPEDSPEIINPLYNYLHGDIEIKRTKHNSNNDDNAIAIYQFTGGTTGKIKAAVIEEKNLISNLQQIERCFTEKELSHGEETMLTVLPMYHIFSFTFNFLFFLRMSCHNILIESPKNLDLIVSAINSHNVSYMTAVSNLLNMLTKNSEFNRSPPENMKFVIAGGASLDQAVAQRWKTITGVEICEGYGLTEASPVVSINPPSGPVKMGSVGKPLDQTEVMIVSNNNEPCSTGMEGEIAVKGPQVCGTYLDEEKETTNTFKSGWLYTGDIGKLDRDGYLYILDRKKDVIDINGFNVYPKEIESIIMTVDGVNEVAVLGIKTDNLISEKIVAFVTCHNTLQKDLIFSACEAHLTNYKRPKEVFIVESLPRSNVGKVLKNTLLNIYKGSQLKVM